MARIPPATGKLSDMGELDLVLRYYPADCRPRRVESLGSAGGMSGAQFWRIAAPRGVLALRRWPAEHPNANRLSFIHAVLHHAAQGGITFVPVPIRTSGGGSFVEHAGHLWELAPWLRGTADYWQSPRVEKLRAALTALGQFHIATADFTSAGELNVAGKTPAIARHLNRLRELSHGGRDELSRAITESTWPDLAPLAHQFIAALPPLIRKAIAQLDPLAGARLPVRTCLRDIWHDHVLFTGDCVTGIIDFGALDFDTPATDVARLLGSLVADDAAGWQTGLAAYSAVRPLSQQESLAVFALDASGTILAGCNWIRWIYIDRRRFENPAQIVERFRRVVMRISTQ